jgi:hypothetical protein
MTHLPIPVQRNVPHLSSRIVLSAVQLTVDNDGRTHTGPYYNVNHALLVTTGAVVEIPQSRSLGIVLQAHGHSQPIGQHVAQGAVVQIREVRRVHQHPRFVVQWPGTADAQGSDSLSTRQGALEFANTFADAFDNGLRPFVLVRRHTSPVYDAILAINQPQFDLCSPQINTDYQLTAHCPLLLR